MKTLKKILPIILLLLAVTLIGTSCNSNDNNNPNTPTNGFTAGGTFYETTNCYIEEDAGQTEVNFFFLNGKMKVNTTNYEGYGGDYLFSVGTSNVVFYNIRDIENPSIVTPYPNIQNGNQYTGSDNDSMLIYNGQVTTFNTPFMDNGVEYGYGNNSGTQIVGSSPTITINSFNYDFQTQTGTIDVDYNFNGITGHYAGDASGFVD